MQKYGMIYSDKLPIIGDYVMVHRPEDIEAVFRKGEGRYPSRLSFPPWMEVREELGVGLGIVLLEEEKWFKRRAPISKFTMIPRKVAEFYKDFNAITHDLILAMRRFRVKDTDVLHDVPALLFNWSFESASFFVLGKRMGCLPDPSHAPHDCQLFIEAIGTFFRSSQELALSLPLYKLLNTKPWRNLKESVQTINTNASLHIQQRLNEIKEKDLKAEGQSGEEEVPEKVDFLTYIIHSGQMSLDDIVVNAVDLIGGGVDTTSMALAWTLYCLASNPYEQGKLRAEIQSVVGMADTVTPEDLNNMPHLRSCVKEALRLYPIAPNNSRLLKEDVVLSDYHVPAGTTVLMPLTVIGRMADVFPDPLRYLPERWSHDRDKGVHMFASLPFGFGSRMCIGRRIAELEIHIALTQIIKHFEVSFPDKMPLGIKEELLNVPNRPMNLIFKDL